MNKTEKIIAAGLVVIALMVSGLYVYKANDFKAGVGITGDVINTTSRGFTATTSTINTTSTQVYAFIENISYIVNSSTAAITCSLDARNSTAASSTVTAGRGVIIGPTSGTALPSEVSFGQCVAGSVPCYQHTGAVNCVASAATTIVKLVQ